MTYLYCYDSMLTKKTQRGVQDDGSRKDQKADKKFFVLERGRKNVHGSVGGSACPSFYSGCIVQSCRWRAKHYLTRANGRGVEKWEIRK